MDIKIPLPAWEYEAVLPWIVILLVVVWFSIKQHIAEARHRRLQDEINLWYELYELCRRHAKIQDPRNAFKGFFEKSDFPYLKPKDFKRIQNKINQ